MALAQEKEKRPRYCKGALIRSVIHYSILDAGGSREQMVVEVYVSTSTQRIARHSPSWLRHGSRPITQWVTSQFSPTKPPMSDIMK